MRTGKKNKHKIVPSKKCLDCVVYLPLYWGKSTKPMARLVLLLLCLLALSATTVCAQSPAGVYTVLRNDVYGTFDSDFSFILASEINTYTAFPSKITFLTCLPCICFT